MVKNQALPAYDPRGVQGIGVTYATTPMGPTTPPATRSRPTSSRSAASSTRSSPEGQVDLSRNLQIATAAIDSTGMCLFIAFAMLDQPETFQALIDLLNAFYGLSPDRRRRNRSERRSSRGADFNTRAGFTQDDRLPRFFKAEKFAPHHVTFGVKDEDLDQVFNWYAGR